MISRIRNFCIIAHIDHGKSTLADRFLELTGTVPKEKMRPQVLDQHPLERERGITIKMQPVRMIWQAPNHAEVPNSKCQISNKFQNPNGQITKSLGSGAGDLELTNSKQQFVLNLIDTPGHVDFSFEVSRALYCVEGAILLVDATQGIQAQTLANLQLAKAVGLTIIPAVNKIDLSHAEIEKTKAELKNLTNCEPTLVSAKTGQGVEELLERVVDELPPPKIEAADHRVIPDGLRALVFDSLYDEHRGMIVYLRVFEGEIKAGEPIYFLGSGAQTKSLEVGIFSPERQPVPTLGVGEIGYVVTKLKYIRLARVGETVTKSQISNAKCQNQISTSANRKPLKTFEPPSPMVWANIFPHSPTALTPLRQALEKLQLNDAALVFESINSAALGPGFRVGVLGLLHLEIVSERLKRDFGQSVIITQPSISFKVVKRSGEELNISSLTDLPDWSAIARLKEPWLQATIITPSRYLGSVMELGAAARGILIENNFVTADKVVVRYELPLLEVIVDFYDRLKSATAGYASMSYNLKDYRTSRLERLDIFVAGQLVEPLSQLVHQSKINSLARALVTRLKESLPRENFEVRIQATVGGRIITSERLPALRKDVTAKLYGGDVTRKRKLLEKQAAGKKRLRQFGKVRIPTEVFWSVLKRPTGQ